MYVRAVLSRFWSSRGIGRSTRRSVAISLSIGVLGNCPIGWADDCTAVKLLPPAGSDFAGFGAAVAASPDRIVVGAPSLDDVGAAFVYRRDGTQWVEEAELTPSDLTDSSGFGASCSMTDLCIAVSAPQDNLPDVNTGRVSVFEFDAKGWRETARLVGPARSSLGYSVALNGDVLVAGAPFVDLDSGRIDGGQVHVYRRVDGVWIEEAILPQPDAPFGEQYFGTAVAVSGDWIAVGEGAEDSAPGRTFLYEYTDGAWSLHTVIDHHGCVDCNYGFKLSMQDDLLIENQDGGGDFNILYQRDVEGNWNEAEFFFGSGSIAGRAIISGNYILEGFGPDGARLHRRSADGWVEMFGFAGPDGAGLPGQAATLNGSWAAFGDWTLPDSGSFAGGVHVIPIAIDCNNNGISDACDVATGASSDANADGVPDDCQPNICPRGGCENLDIAGNDCVIDLGDLGLLLANFNREGWDIAGDSDTDGDVDLADLGAMLAAWGANCTFRAAEEEPR